MKYKLLLAPLFGALMSPALAADMPATAAHGAAVAGVQRADEEVLDNATIIALVDAGLGAEAIIAKIRSTKGDFDGSTMAMIELKNAGVPDEVIAAMLDDGAAQDAKITLADNESPDPTVPHSPGIYMFYGGEEARMAKIDPTVPTQAKTSGLLGYALTSGIASMKIKIVVPNHSARIKTDDVTPTLYFFFNPEHQLNGVSQFGSSFSVTAVSPAEFALVEFDSKEKKNRREASVGSINLGGAKSGVSDKDRIGFDYNEVAPGVFEVKINQPLPAGEYGFVYSMGGSTGQGQLAGATRIFDFAVQ
ncbi:hypothetical protein [Sphingomicrobium flavum]|uniref:hypothetical protein n=1 Tax=Sphingomicrobium flavum TaxID=1229164 RepID=UPI0021AD99DA|nr:hypothetical protein [Sphingomicrobium flavum]